MKKKNCYTFKDIAGTRASDVNFQSFLVEGVATWNDDRASDRKASAPRCDDHKMRFALNSLSQNVLGIELHPAARPLSADTGWCTLIVYTSLLHNYIQYICAYVWFIMLGILLLF